MTRGNVLLELEIDIDSEPISDSVRAGDGEACPFAGWIELVAAIEEARAHEHGVPSPPAKAWGAALVRSGSEGS